MLPIGTDYCTNPYPMGIIPYCPSVLFFNSYSPWNSPYNYLSTFTNFGSQNPVSCDPPSETMQSRKLSFEKNSVSEKSKECSPINSGLIRNPYFAQQQFNSDGFKLWQQNNYEDQSSYNLKRKKNSTQSKKIKRGPKNSNRNILPSIVQQILSFLSKPTKSKQICQKIFSNLGMEPEAGYTISRYYCFIKSVKDKQNHYMNEKTLELLNKIHEIGINLFTREEQGFYLKVARILASYFLNHLCPFLIVRSKRIVQEKRIEHLNIRKALLKKISQLHC